MELNVPEVEQAVSQAEWQVRTDLAALYRSTDTGHLQLRQLVFDRRQVAIGGV